LAALEFAPCRLSAKVGLHKDQVTIEEVTDYPFDEHIEFELNMEKPVDFSLTIRIPGWCRESVILLNGQELRREKGGRIISLRRVWEKGDRLTVKLPMDVRISQWGRNSRAVERGPLVYALKLGERWEKGYDEKEGDYFCVYPVGNWNYGLLEKAVLNPAEYFIYRKRSDITEGQQKENGTHYGMSRGFVWNMAHVPGELSASGRRIPSWQLYNDVAPIPVTDRNGVFKGSVNDSIEKITLVPYGFTKVRIVAFPVVP
jgi:hypothetical protein